MDSSSLLSEGSSFTAHDVLPQLPGYRSNANRSGNRRSAMRYHSGQRIVVDSASSIVPARKMLASSTATGFAIGTGKPNHR